MPENATKVLLALGLALCLPAALSAQPPGGPPGGPPPIDADTLDGLDSTDFLTAVTDHDIGNFGTAVGKDAIASNTSFSNTASGYRALFSNTTGSNNTASGSYALYFNT